MLYTAMRRRFVDWVSPELFGKWVKKDIVRSVARKGYLVVPAANMTAARRQRVLDVDADAILGPSKIASIDPGIDLSQNFIVDHVVDRNMLGVGAYFTVVTTGSEHSYKHSMRSHPSSGVHALPDAPRARALPAPAVEDEAPQEPAPQARAAEAAGASAATGAAPCSRAVARHPSNVSDGGPCEDVVARDLAQTPKACFEAGRYCTKDAHLSNFAINKGKSTEFNERAFFEALTPWLRKCPKYVAKALLSSEALEHLGHFAGAFKQLSDALPSAVGNLGKALAVLAASRVDSDESMKLDFMDLGERQFFKDSRLYKAFDKRRAAAKISNLRAASTRSDAGRKAAAEALLPAAATDEGKEDVTFAKALFSGMVAKEKAKYLFSLCSLERLRSWKADHPLLLLEPWLRPGTTWAEVLGEAFEKAADAFIGQDCPVEPAANRVLRELLKERRKLLAAAPEDDFVKKVGKACFLEGAGGKLGAPGCAVAKVDQGDMRLPARMNVAKVIGKAMGKTAKRTSASKPESTAAAVWQAHAEPQQAAKKGDGKTAGAGAAATAEAAPPAGAASAAAVAAGGRAPAADPGGGEAAAGAQDAGAASAVLKKKEHRSKRAVIETAPTQHYWIKFEEGDVGVKGSSIKTLQNNAEPIMEGGAPALAAPAGQSALKVTLASDKKRTSTADETSAGGRAAKRARSEQEADGLFGLSE
ncbi:unnamed protein product [Prorocentrum cordatum]|uniref:Uncharacterized protein n=1 Tax=Prorocentrum cordatum TaxID=2364126 RepID=A0ABN9R133_9DINO|nr:unnamed protein product [Polarella glacialis]